MLMKKYLNEDKKAKSQSFFLKTETMVLNKKFINFLEKKYFKTKKDLRICMHESKKSNHHNMIILQQRRNFYSPEGWNDAVDSFHRCLG